MWLNTSASHTQPPAGVTADASQYALLGGRLAGDFSWGGITLNGRYGGALAGTDGRWFQGDASVVAGRRVGTVGLRTRLSGFGLRYLDAATYDAGGVEVRPTVAIPVGRLVISALPHLAFGRWATETVEGDIQVLGGGLELSRSFGAVTTVVSGDLSDVENGATAGTFAQAAAGVILDRGRWTAGARVEGQRTPEEAEIGGGVYGSVTAHPALEILAYAGRRLRDPIFGTPGSLTVSLTASVRAVRWTPPSPPPVVEIGEASNGGRTVRFAIRAPEADAVALTGDFTGWEPVPMERGDGDWWQLARELEPGLHHFGFLVDGDWAIPEDAPGVVEDGWGRRNASIVVEP